MKHFIFFLVLSLSIMFFTSCFEKSKTPATSEINIEKDQRQTSTATSPNTAETLSPVSAREAKHRYGLIEIEANAIHYTIVKFNDTKTTHEVVKTVDNFNPKTDQENAATFNTQEATRKNLINKLNNVLRNNESLLPERIQVVYYDDNNLEVKEILSLLPSNYKVQKSPTATRLSEAQRVEILLKKSRYSSQLQ